MTDPEVRIFPESSYLRTDQRVSECQRQGFKELHSYGIRCIVAVDPVFYCGEVHESALG
jgi:hypothetical protein